MATKKVKELRVVFWHNDFPDGSRQNSYFGKDGPLAKQARKGLYKDTELKWHFHGGHITPERTTLIKRLKQADVLISAYPWNMDMDNEHMHWHEAESSMLQILQDIKKENTKLKVFFLREPFHLKAELAQFAEFTTDIHDEIIINYFRDL